MTKKQDNTLFFGEALKTFGIDGGLIIKLSPDAPEKLNTKEPVFITFDGLSVPFYFKSFEYRGRDKLLAVFEDIESEEAATELIARKIYFASTKEPSTQADDLSIFIGYTLYDTQIGELGAITEFFDFPGNPCFQCFYHDKEILIPINEDLIVKLDHNKQSIYLKLPDGLLEI